MFKYLFLTIFILILSGAQAQAGSTHTAVFKLSVYIPPIVGVNVPSAGQAGENPSIAGVKQDTVIEKVIRNDQHVVLKTTVVK